MNEKVGAGGTAHTPTATLDKAPAWGFLAFVAAFIIYGSLFPFDFLDSPEPFDKLLSSSKLFANTTDAIDNFLLFVPLAFALYASFRRTRDRLIASAFAILSLGLGLQILQLYLPSRTASIADVTWNSIGLMVGLFMASIVHRSFSQRFASFSTASPFALLLVLLWFFYEAFPFVPTLDYGLLRDHIKPAVFAPPFETLRFMQHMLAAILAGIALQRANLFGRSGRATVLAGSAAVLLEVFVVYGSLRRETLLGMILGLAGGYLLARRGDRLALISLLIVATSAYLMTILTPYRGQIADAGFTLTPFSNFLWHNVTHDLPPLAFEALAIGSLLWAGLLKQDQSRRHPALWIMTVFMVIVGLETIRVLVLGFHGDTTTLLITVVLGPFAAAYRDRTNTTSDRQPDAPFIPQKIHRSLDRAPSPVWKAFAISLFLLSAAIYAVAHLPGMPYNVRELIPAGFQGVIAALNLSAIILLAANSPFLLLKPESRRLLMLFPLLLPAQGLIIWILLRIVVPMESIGDIIGTPILNWPWEWEMILRFLALHQAVAMQLLGAVLFVATLRQSALLAGFVYWLTISLLLSWPLHYLVVDQAATDNLTELMRDNAAFSSSSLLATGIWMLGIAGSALASVLFDSSRRGRLLSVAVIATLLAATAIQTGLEPMLVKYGKAFSALQFLLSPDRQHYLPDAEITIRFIAALGILIAIIATLQASSWKRFSYRSSHGKRHSHTKDGDQR